MNEILFFLLGGFLGYIASRLGQSSPPIDEILQNQVEKLEEDVKYYKDLCKWHVEQKRKEQEIRDKFERESG